MDRAIRRPEWAAAGTFAEAWQTTRSQLDDDLPSEQVEMVNHYLALLYDAHVVTIEPEQVNALPRLPRSDEDAIRNARLPFDVTYLSFGDLKMSQEGFLLRGVLMSAGAIRDEGRTVMLMIPYFCDCERRAYLPPQMGQVVVDQTNADAKGFVVDERFSSLYQPLALEAIWQAFDILYFLESVNVELVDGEASRQERRQVARKGGKIALTVRVRQPRRRPRSGAEAQHVDYSHRWEVRGHYKHFPAGTRLADAAPEKLVHHDGVGLCRRVWCPPFVKGPEDKPLVPKVRVVR